MAVSRRTHWYRITRIRAGRQVSAVLEGRSVVYPYGAALNTATGVIAVHDHDALDEAVPAIGSAEIKRRDWRQAWITRAPPPPDGLNSRGWSFDDAPA